jgi:hypothetical protein
MEATIDLKLKKEIIAAMLKGKELFTGSEKQYAKSLGFDGSIYSQLKNGKIEGDLLSKGKWIGLARRFDVLVGNQQEWITVNTATYALIKSQMLFCAENSLSTTFCDLSDIGKSHTAVDVVKRTKNSVYLDCSNSKTKQLFVRAMAKAFGVDDNGRYNDVKNDLIFYIKTLENPLIVLDEFGDINYDAFLEVKALWNATEGMCAWYVIGADGLKVKLERGRSCKKVGFTEFFTRFGKMYQTVVPAGKEDSEAFHTNQVAQILKANLPATANLQQAIKKCNGSLRRTRIEVRKAKSQA